MAKNMTLHPVYITNELKNLKFPLPIVKTIFTTCKTCKYCCQWCDYISETGCTAPSNYEMLSLCNSFPILIGSGYGRYPSLGVGSDQFPPEFGAFVQAGNHCLSLEDERQRSFFQFAAKKLNEGKRKFSLYLQEEDFSIYIEVKDPIESN